MRLSNLIARVEDATIAGAAKAKSFAAEFKADLREARAKRLVRQMEEQASLLTRAMEIMAEREINKP